MTDHSAAIVIVGAGAAGLTSAIAAAQRFAHEQIDGRVLLLDGAKQIGAKILVSGGGRCNITHDVVTPKDFSAIATSSKCAGNISCRTNDRLVCLNGS